MASENPLVGQAGQGQWDRVRIKLLLSRETGSSMD